MRDLSLLKLRVGELGWGRVRSVIETLTPTRAFSSSSRTALGTLVLEWGRGSLPPPAPESPAALPALRMRASDVTSVRDASPFAADDDFRVRDCDIARTIPSTLTKVQNTKFN